MEFMNGYFLKFCQESNYLNCKQNQCQYRIYCSRYKILEKQQNKEKTK